MSHSRQHNTMILERRQALDLTVVLAGAITVILIFQPQNVLIAKYFAFQLNSDSSYKVAGYSIKFRPLYHELPVILIE